MSLRPFSDHQHGLLRCASLVLDRRLHQLIRFAVLRPDLDRNRAGAKFTLQSLDIPLLGHTAFAIDEEPLTLWPAPVSPLERPVATPAHSLSRSRATRASKISSSKNGTAP